MHTLCIQYYLYTYVCRNQICTYYLITCVSHITYTYTRLSQGFALLLRFITIVLA
jgi:hypothetical protein